MKHPTTTIPKRLRPPKVRKPLRLMRLHPFIASLLLLAASGTAIIMYRPSTLLWLSGLPQAQLPGFGKGLAIYDCSNQEVCTIYGERNEQPVHLEAISQNVKHAIIAAEDHDFYSHDGINLLSVARAVMVDIAHHRLLQGGSTLSQQLVKNLYFGGKKRTVLDKMGEAAMALDMETHYSKDAILEAYLNCVYFGNGAYGIECAAQQYFGMHAAQLDVAQSAFLAGLVTAPSELCRPENRARAVGRQQLVINSMKELGFIDAALAQRAGQEKLMFHLQLSNAQRYRYYTSEVLQLLKREFGDDDIYARGYRVYTYLDPKAQRLAERTLSAGIRRAPRGINQGALVSISVPDGGIIALVGGAGPYDRNQWNRAISPHTAGSVFKPFVYLAGLAEGVLAPDTMLDDAPLQIKQAGAPVYRPRNFDGRFLGPITIRQALALSRNTCAVRVAQQVGADAIVAVAHQAGITSKLDANLSLALGSSAVSPLEMANSYATLARGGQYVDAQMVRRIEDAGGRTLKEYQQQRRRSFAPEPVAQLVDALEDVVERGTGKAARLFGRPVAGKTGTADEARDIWFIGFTPDTVTAVWGGNDDHQPVAGHVSGGSVMASIWQDYMRGFYLVHNLPPGEFIKPEHPLIEIENAPPPHPAPDGIFDHLFQPLFGTSGANPHTYPGSQFPTAAPDRDGAPPQSPAPQLPAGRKGLFRRFLDYLHL